MPPVTRRLPNPTAASLLGFLHEGPMSGWDLAAKAETLIGDFWSLTRSQVYRELATMAERGLVEAGEPGARSRRVYRLTDRGREVFDAWIDREPDAETIRFPLLLTVGFGRHLSPERLEQHVAVHRRAHEGRLASYRHQMATLRGQAEPDRYALATLEFGIAYESAVLDWFDQLPRLLATDPTP